MFDLQNEVIKPTISGMLDIMKACVDAKTVKKLVFTSSAGTVNVEPNQKSAYDETCWSDIDFCRTVKMTGWVIFFFLFITIREIEIRIEQSSLSIMGPWILM